MYCRRPCAEWRVTDEYQASCAGPTVKVFRGKPGLLYELPGDEVGYGHGFHSDILCRKAIRLLK
jgi:hypothetical protein